MLVQFTEEDSDIILSTVIICFYFAYQYIVQTYQLRLSIGFVSKSQASRKRQKIITSSEITESASVLLILSQFAGRNVNAPAYLSFSEKCEENGLSGVIVPGRKKVQTR